MKALAGPAMLLVVVGGFFLYRTLGADQTPSRQFAELEFAGADEAVTGSCYSLTTVLVANGIYGRAPRTWAPGESSNQWILTLESVEQGFNGPVHDFQKFTFEKLGEKVRLISVDVSKGRAPDLKHNIDMLLEAPNDRHSTPVDRCLHGGTGYHYDPKR